MPVDRDFTTPFACGACGTKQRFYAGDPDDLTIPDREAVRCCKCGAVELIEDEFAFRSAHGLWDDDDKPIPITPGVVAEHAYIEDGFVPGGKPG